MIRGMDMSGHILLLLFPSIENKNKKSTVRYMKQFLKQRSKAISQAQMSEKSERDIFSFGLSLTFYFNDHELVVKMREFFFLLYHHSPFISISISRQCK